MWPLVVVPVCTFPTWPRLRGAQAIEIVKRDAWNISKFLASFASLGEVEGVNPKRRPTVASMHQFGGKGASPDMKAVDPFMNFPHDIVCLLAIQVFEKGCCRPSFE